jgi:drug/metabolite transporter (DMT)-like permease
MSPFATLLLAILLVSTTAGQLLFKAASLRAQATKSRGRWWSLAREPGVWIGIFIYGFDFVVWLAFLSFVPLWQAVMVANLDIVLVMLCGRLFFGERLSRPRVIGVSLITIGVITVGYGI